MKKNLLLTIFAMCFITFGFSQTDCGTALALTPGTPQAGITTIGGSFPDANTAPTNPCSANYNDNEYWFQYTAVETGETLDLTVTDLTVTWYGLFILDACPGSTPTCIASDVNTSVTTDLAVTSPALTAGTTYYIVLTEWAESSTAFTLTSVVNAAPTCTASTSTVSTVSDCGVSGGFYVKVAITDLGSATALTVSDDQGNLPQPLTVAGTLQFGPYVNGVNVVITINDDNDDDTCTVIKAAITQAICPPSNNTCANPDSLTVNADFACAAVTSGTLVGATASGENETACFGTENDDVWYSFVATATSHNVSLINKTGTPTDLYHSLWSGSCGALTNLKCSDADSSLTSGLVIGDTYLVRVNSYSSSAGATSTFDICVGTPPAPPANDDCAGALVLNESTVGTCDNAVSGTTVSATASSEADCSTTNKDVWYTFEPSETNSYDISVTEIQDFGFSSTYVSVFEGACGAITQVGTACNTSSGSFALTAGTTYYINVRSTSTTTGVNFSLCAALTPPPPANDECSGAITIACAGQYTGNTTSASPESPDPGTCTTSAGTAGAVWYTFTGANSNDAGAAVGTVGDEVTLDLSLSTFDTKIRVFEGVCGALTCVGGNDDGGTGNTSLYTFAATVGTEYYILVHGFSTNAGAYTLDVSCVAPPLCTAAVVDSSTVVEDCANSLFTVDVVFSNAGDAGTVISDGLGGSFPVIAGTVSAGPYAVGTTVTLDVVHTDGDCDFSLGNFSDDCPSSVVETVDCSGTALNQTYCYDEYEDAIFLYTSSDLTRTLSITFNQGTLEENFSGGTYDDLVIYDGGDNTGAVLFDSDVSGGDLTGLTFVSTGNMIFMELTSDVSNSCASGDETSLDFDVACGATMTTDEFDSPNAFTYYPNPVSNVLNVKAQNNISNVSVYNMLGQEVLRTAPNAVASEVDMSNLQTGAYFVKVTIGNTTKTIRVIKN
ncbi:T9SS type A sorting domain-containing protein [Bizionia myxarmorum]|uniref:T9SS type A sorting domain-containing protein n=1 Tax=Bizionia myxarmorum TaxID=291186 RepID=A0A5D0R941_9FLAO|nr:T9SS type A sorting domain-containing protein [Bizionia myxarmorum]TYB77198.1 T9SS type A sorting domain-containing protein [Bizionia myxarmorum]